MLLWGEICKLKGKRSACQIHGFLAKKLAYRANQDGKAMWNCLLCFKAVHLFRKKLAS